MTKEEILQKALNIKKDQEHIKICVNSGICPECEETLKKHRIDKSNEWWDITECPVNTNHYKNTDYDCFDGDYH